MDPIVLKYGENPHTIPLDFFPSSSGSKWFSLYRSLEITLSNGDKITIPAGFKTDLASVPKFLWGFFPPFGKGLLAYIIHDYLYVEKLYNRSFSDKEMVLWAEMLTGKTFDPRARYYTVRLFGWVVWKKIIKV